MDMYQKRTLLLQERSRLTKLCRAAYKTNEETGCQIALLCLQRDWEKYKQVEAELSNVTQMISELEELIKHRKVIPIRRNSL